MRLPSSSVGSPNIAGSGAGWAANSAVISPWWLTASDELGHGRPEAAALVRVADRLRDRHRTLAVGQDRRERGLVRDERPDVLRMLRHQGQRIHRAAAAGEQVDRAADRRDDAVDVVGVLLGRRLVAGSALMLRSTPRGS